MEYEFRDDRIYLLRTEEERAPLLRRLRRIRGQLGGIEKMIEEDRYCPDELQQLKAALSGIRELMLMLADQHLDVASKVAAETRSEAALADIRRTLAAALKISE